MENYRIYWNYTQEKPMIREGLYSAKLREVTHCVVETGKEVVFGTVRQYYKDAPNRKLARRESFKRAVLGLSKEDRKIAWSVFNTKFPKCVNCN